MPLLSHRQHNLWALAILHSSDTPNSSSSPFYRQQNPCCVAKHLEPHAVEHPGPVAHICRIRTSWTTLTTVEPMGPFLAPPPWLASLCPPRFPLPTCSCPSSYHESPLPWIPGSMSPLPRSPSGTLDMASPCPARPPWPQLPATILAPYHPPSIISVLAPRLEFRPGASSLQPAIQFISGALHCLSERRFNHLPSSPCSCSDWSRLLLLLTSGFPCHPSLGFLCRLLLLIWGGFHCRPGCPTGCLLLWVSCPAFAVFFFSGVVSTATLAATADIFPLFGAASTAPPAATEDAISFGVAFITTADAFAVFHKGCLLIWSGFHCHSSCHRVCLCRLFLILFLSPGLLRPPLQPQHGMPTHPEWPLLTTPRLLLTSSSYLGRPPPPPHLQRLSLPPQLPSFYWHLLPIWSGFHCPRGCLLRPFLFLLSRMAFSATPAGCQASTDTFFLSGAVSTALEATSPPVSLPLV